MNLSRRKVIEVPAAALAALFASRVSSAQGTLATFQPVRVATGLLATWQSTAWLGADAGVFYFGPHRSGTGGIGLPSNFKATVRKPRRVQGVCGRPRAKKPPDAAASPANVISYLGDEVVKVFVL